MIAYVVRQKNPELRYEAEVVGSDVGMHGRLAMLLKISKIGVKRYATEARPIPEYVAQELRAMVLLARNNLLNELDEMP